MTSKQSPSAISGAEAREILRQRARVLAQPLNKASEDRPFLEVVEFRLAQEHYAIEHQYVQEVFPLNALTPLPGLPSFYVGIINVRGQIVPVIDLKKFFDLPDSGITDLHVALIVRMNDIELGILADSVSRTRALPVEALQPSLPTLSGIRMQFLKGVSNEQVVVLDAARILQDPQLVVNQEIES